MNQTDEQFENQHPSQQCDCYESELIGVMKINAEGIIQNVNTYLASMLHCTANDLIGVPWETLIMDEELKPIQQWWQDLWRTNQPQTIETRLFSRQKNTAIPTLITARLLPDQRQLLLILQDISTIKAKTEEILSKEKQKYDVLIREIHHRIKNNLQGIVGLLNNERLNHPEVSTLLEAPIRQINSIALIYNLRSRSLDDRIYLCDLVKIATRASQKFGQVPIVTEIPNYTIEVNDGEAVSLTLVLNELLFNAIKHSNGPNSRVTLTVEKTSDCVKIRIRNRYQGNPLKLDMASGKGLGTGLQLVRSLLPKDRSAQLIFQHEGEEVIAELKLREPLIRFIG